MSKLLYEYTNGNYQVEIYRDGTKIRILPDDVFFIPQPEFPESIDLKITNMCDKGCLYCHEKSVPKGLHANREFLYNLIDSFSPGMEIAIGGGNPLDYPYLFSLLFRCINRDLIPNVTLNQDHFDSMDDYNGSLFCNNIYGLGISLMSTAERFLNITMPKLEALDKLQDIVLHVIPGVNDIDSVKTIIKGWPDAKILILGYKKKGRGEVYYKKNSDVFDQIEIWKNDLSSLFFNRAIISFDNLAIRQLHVKRYISCKDWDKFYMGDDGRYTMYIDAVNQEFAISSTNVKRYKIQEPNIKEIWKQLKQLS